MQGFQQGTAGSSPVCEREFTIDATTIGGVDSSLELVSRASIMHGC